ncbi:hypothetical protein MA4S0726RB_3745 [Mycobacteroides abscessus 4S-0726-RB]|nr:hypothetical protein MA4S0726RB_3745 [Mycobacteroides abscessus 4S-0726-RB]EIV60393.1 hypothetical protein MA4S0116S_3294 [Mycobacteroides abscessus 4S-0116-S]
MATEVPASAFRVILWRDTTVRRAGQRSSHRNQVVDVVLG